MSDPAHPLTLWLVRASMVFYAVAVLIAVSQSESSRSTRLWRVSWSMACVLLITHVLSAFHFEHHWSHAAALHHTARQTARVTGIDWGGGLYFNYVFLILWSIDVAYSWRGLADRHSPLHRITNAACIFMVVNATVVFGPGWWLWPVGTIGAMVIVIQQRSRAPS